MNALEHVGFVLATAVHEDAISKAELLDFLRELITASLHETGEDTEEMRALSVKLGKRFRHVIYPGGVKEGEDT